MNTRLGFLLMLSSAVIVTPAAAQDAKSFLQAADKAMGASSVNSVSYSGTGTIHYPGQSFETNADWPGAPIKTYSATIDYGSKSSKENYTTDTNNPSRGGGIRNAQVADFTSGGFAWNLNAQGQPNPQPGAAELRQFMITISPYGFIKAALAANDATLTERYFNRLDKTMKVVGFTSGRYRVTGEFDDNNMLERVVTWFPSPVMGNMQIEVRYITRMSGAARSSRSTSTPIRATIPSSPAAIGSTCA